MPGLNSAQIKDLGSRMGRNLSDQDVQSILQGAWDQSQFGADEGKVMAMLGGGSSSSSNSNKVPTAQDILNEQLGKIKEQVSFLGDFMRQNPFSFDEQLARNMADEKFKPYYQEVLQDFVNPLQTKISRSTEDQTRLVDEIVRKRSLGETQISRDTQSALDKAREGFAGSGLLGSGLEKRSTGITGIQGNEKLQDFTAKSLFDQQGTTLDEQRKRQDFQTAIGQKERDIFGTGREFDTKVAQDVLGQETRTKQTYGSRLLEAVNSRFGASLVGNIPDYLKLA